MNFNNNACEEKNIDSSFFNNKNNSLAWETTNPLDPEYLNAMAFDNLFTTNDRKMKKSNSPQNIIKFRKPFAVQSSTSYNSKAATADTINDKQTSATKDNKKSNAKQICKCGDQMAKAKWKIENTKQWRKKERDRLTDLEGSVQNLKRKRNNLQNKNKEKEEALLKRFLIKTMPDQVSEIKDSLFREDNSNQSILDNINKYKEANCPLKTDNNKQEEAVKDLYLGHVTQLLTGYETFYKERAKLNEG